MLKLVTGPANYCDYKSIGSTHDTARNLLHLATAEAELNNFTGRRSPRSKKLSRFLALLVPSPGSQIRNYARGRIALKQGDIKTPHQAALIASASFNSTGQQVNYASAALLAANLSWPWASSKQRMRRPRLPCTLLNGIMYLAFSLHNSSVAWTNCGGAARDPPRNTTLPGSRCDYRTGSRLDNYTSPWLS